jgi:hypothetical protein
MSLFKFSEVAHVVPSNKAKHDTTPEPFNELTAAIAKEEALNDMKENHVKKGYIKELK